MKNKNISAEQLQPREKIAKNGPFSLSDEELIAVLLGSGIKNIPLKSLAKEVLRVLDQRNGSLRLEDLLNIHGIGMAKAALLISALEFARRRIRPKGIKVSSAKDVYPLVRHWADRRQEHFISVTLDGAHQVIATRVVTVGTLNSSQIHPRELFADAISDRAAAVIVAHNHPSGELTPSAEDLQVTARLKKGGELLGIKLLDHLIFSLEGFISITDSTA